MKQGFIVLSGVLCSGKTKLADAIRANFSVSVFSKSDLLTQRLTVLGERPTAAAGRRLEVDTVGRWLKEALARRMMEGEHAQRALFVVDGVDSPGQVQGLRDICLPVLHVHLTAPDSMVRRRYNSSKKRGAESFETLRHAWGSKLEDQLVREADVVIDTERCSLADVFARVRARLEPNPATAAACVDVLVGGQYGSEGKGNVAQYLAREYDVLVRVGGPNAGHTVYRHNAKPYTFRQVPSGFLGNRDAMLVIGAGAVIGLETLRKEIGELNIGPENLIIDPRAIIISDKDRKWEEETLKHSIGSTAQGTGMATARKVLRYEHEPVQLADDEQTLKPFIKDTIEYYAECLSSGKKIMLEGTQGTLLSLHHGSYPHVTSRATTAAACLAESGLTQRHVRRVVMVCRTYPIRVGNSDIGRTSGPMGDPVKELTFNEISRRSGVSIAEIKSTEIGSVSKRPRRIAEFDWEMLRRSLMLNGPTDLALTFTDYLGVKNRDAFRYEQLTEETQRFIGELEKVSGLPVSLISTSFAQRSIIDRRMW